MSYGVASPKKPWSQSLREMDSLDRFINAPLDYTIKSRQQREIDGEFGPAQTGVQNYPYAPSERLYNTDFKAIVSNRLAHPYCNTAVAGAGSIPFNILSGSSFNPAASSNWVSEQMRAYEYKSSHSIHSIAATGIRTECTAADTLGDKKK